MRTLRGADLLIATGNAGKMDEFSSLLLPFGTRLLSLRDLGLNEPEETESSFAGNALLKARAGAKLSGLPTLADDSGLEVEALSGAPGIHTADWAEGEQGRDFGVAMNKTWDFLVALGPKASRKARFCCVLALVWPDGEERVFEGHLEGQLDWPMRGVHGHGYDPFFVPIGQNMTLGEMERGAKNAISHRAVAVKAFVASCFT